MAVFRIEKTQNYTVMSNHHLRNAALTLKAKGLLSQMLSLPENWDYSAFEIYREIIQDNIEYDIMAERYPYDRDRIDEIVDLMLETICTARKTIRIAGDDYPAELVKGAS